jgi:predicted nucleic acid-binding protein
MVAKWSRGLSRLPEPELSDRKDLPVVELALRSDAEISITGDWKMPALRATPGRLRIANPRRFWNMAVD